MRLRLCGLSLGGSGQIGHDQSSGVLGVRFPATLVLADSGADSLLRTLCAEQTARLEEIQQWVSVAEDRSRSQLPAHEAEHVPVP